MSWLERAFEKLLWNLRWAALLGVLGSLASSFAMFYVATVDTVSTIRHLIPYADPRLDPAARAELRVTSVRHVVAIVDGYLLGAVLLMFAFGLYEIFISKIEAAEGSAQKDNVLVIRSLDDLKSRLAKVILLMLIVIFFERVLSIPAQQPLDLIWVAGGVALVGLALWLAHAAESLR